MRKINLISIILFLCLATVIHAQKFKGTVLDKLGRKPIPFAEIYFPDLNTGTTTDENGIFTIDHYDQTEIQLQISFIGYKTISEKINLKKTPQKVFYLEESHFNLDEVVMSAPVGKLQKESIVNVEHIKISKLQQTSPITLAETINNIPGVDINSTGAGIGKPVIRGLSGNRIVTYAQGIRIENQQWGDEHGLGIGTIGIESVEVIKGPASLLYGSDALGGVIFFVDERYTTHNTYEISAQTNFETSTLGSITNLGYKIHKNRFKFNLYGSYSSHADYQLPNAKRVFNTRFDEKNIKSSIGFNQPNWISNIRYSFIQNNYGITEDALFLNSKERNFVLPFQTINNHNLSLENTFFIKNSKLNAIFGYTNNYRREFEDNKKEQALGLKLNTATYNIKWNTPTYKNKYSFIIGTQGMLQKNKNNGEEILIPDAYTNDIGIFGLTNIEFKNIHFQGGVRFDNRNINTQKTANIDKFNKTYQGISFSGGAAYVSDKSKYRLNFSSGFRAPNTSELLSDGVHEGTNRYEKGNKNLNNENAFQVDFTFDYTSEHFEFSINPFYNFIKDYIFLSPTNEVIDNNPVFEYLQKDAFLYGGEVGFHYHPHRVHWLHLESNLSTVFAEDTNGNPLPLIPQTRINTTISTEFSNKNKVSITNAHFQYIYKFEQNRIGAFETDSDGYSLLNAGLVVEIKTKKNPISISTGVKNILNTKYIDHLSRFKTLDIPNPGISYYISLKFKLNQKLSI